MQNIKKSGKIKSVSLVKLLYLNCAGWCW